jgi:uncharacterized protein YcfJ
MRKTLKAALAVAGVLGATQALAGVTLYDDEGFRGHAFSANSTVTNLQPTGFNDKAESAIVDSGAWEVCEDSGFRGRCVVLQQGSYPSLRSTGMLDRISSVRPAAGYPVGSYGSPPVARDGLYEVNVASVHAVVGPPDRRCWVEREQVEGRSGPNIPGAIVGGVLGGVLGHQIGGGRGRDVATAGGAVAGAAIGANVNTGGDTYRDVERCSDMPASSSPDYWDVTYYFRGYEHHAQFNSPPGPTILVDSSGVPRG